MRNQRTDQEILLAFYLAKWCRHSEFPSEIQKFGYNTEEEIIKSFYQKLGNKKPEIILHHPHSTVF
jgi:hypothetical protein